MALGQYIAGMGFSNVGLGIVHSMAHGLSALCDTPTALPVPSSCPPVWSTTRPWLASVTVPSARRWA